MNSTIVPAGITDMPKFLVGKQLVEVRTVTYTVSAVTHMHVKWFDRATGQHVDCCFDRNDRAARAVKSYAKTTSATVLRGTSHS
jgi:hypothetical protein